MTTPTIPPRTLVDVFDQFRLEYFPDKTPGTRYVYQCFFLRTLAQLGNVPLEALTPDLLRTWMTDLARRHKPGSVRAYMKMLAGVLETAVEDWHWLEENPLRKVRKPPAPRGRVRFLTTDERLRLLAACQQSPNTMLYPFVVVFLGTGGRKNEVLRLRWSEVDLERGLVRFLQTKNGDSRTVPVLGDALMLLKQLAELRESGVEWVFPDVTGRKPKFLEFHWKRARAQAGLDDFHVHDLRHTYASYCAMSGASLADIAALLGHKTLQMTINYTHLLQSYTRGVVARMHDQFLTPPPEEDPTHGEGQ